MSITPALGATHEEKEFQEKMARFGATNSNSRSMDDATDDPILQRP